LTTRNANLRGLLEDLGDEQSSDSQFTDSDIFSDSTLKLMEKEEHISQRAEDFSVPSEYENVRLASDGIELREECSTESYSGDNLALKIPDCIEAFREWYLQYEDQYAAFENEQTGEKKKVPLNNSFSPEYTERQYARFCDLERRLKEEYGHRLHTALLSFTCSYTDDFRNPIPPADHFEDLEKSYDAVRLALDRALSHYDDDDWTRVAILEPHKSGYTHIHFAVFVNGRVDESTFHSVIDAHLRNCPSAERPAHDYNSFDQDERPISVYHSGKKTSDRFPELDSLENLSAYLAEYLGNYGNSPLEADEHIQLFYTLMWALRKQRIRPCSNAQDYMILEDDDLEDNDDWNLLGIIFEEDGHIYELNENPGGADTVVIGAPAYL